MSDKQETIGFIFNSTDKTENVFTDIIQIQTNNEVVNLRIGLKNEDNRTAGITHNIRMTLPHFLRFVEVCNKISQETLKNIENLNSIK